MAFSLPIANYGQPPMFGSGNNNSAIIQLLMQMVGQAQGGRDEAKQANVDRYNDILEMFGLNRTRALDSLDNLSGQQVADANKSYNDKRDEILSDLADRGLSGSTKRIGVEMATKRERDAEVNRIQDALALNRNATDLGFTDRATGVMERRSDPYPDTSNIGAMVTQLMGLLNQGGGGGFANGEPTNGNNKLPKTRRLAPDAAIPAQQTAASQVATRANNALTHQDEVNRRKAMASLSTAINQGGYGGEQHVRDALQWLQLNGWAEQNPKAAVGGFVPAQVQRTSETMYQSAPQGAGLYSTPSYYSAPQQQSGYGPNPHRWDELKRQRAAWLNGPTMQASRYMAGLAASMGG